ncbi:MAG: holin family protein [Desulfocapsaceae bacterium]|nr:holin family protein [Desulfocapsaceae bacterium]
MSFDPITAALDIGGKIIDKLWPDPAQADAARLELLKLQQSGELAIISGQLEINKMEAANPSPFASGWRPFVGWVCGSGFAIQFVIGPLAEWAAGLAGHPVQFPQMDMSTMMPLLLGMLGLGGMRSFEKTKS